MPKEQSRVIHFSVPGITCSSCANGIKTELVPKKANDVYVDVLGKKVSIIIDSDIEKTDEEIRLHLNQELSSQYTLEPIAPTDPTSASASAKFIRQHLVKGILGSIFGLALLAMAVSGLVMPLIPLYIIAALSSAATIYLGFDIYKFTILDFIKFRTLGMNALFTVSTLTAIGVSIAAFFVPWLPMMFDAALLILGFKHVGYAIEEAAKRKVMERVTFREQMPRTIKKLENGVEKIVFVKNLVPNDIIIVSKNEIIPVDGLCLVEEAYICEEIYNGEASQTKINKGHQVFGGMRIGEHADSIKIQVTANEENSFPARYDKQLEDARIKKAPIENTADKILRYFVPAVFGLAIISGLVIGCLFPPALAIQCVIATLVSACPCTLGLIVPLAVNIALGKGHDNRVEFKSGEALQAAAEVNTVVFDFNGTLTTGVKEVNIRLEDKSITQEEFLDYLYLLEAEAKDEHPIASTIYHYVEQHPHFNKKMVNQDVQFEANQSHSGICAEIAGRKYRLGNRNLMMQSPQVDMSKYENGSMQSDQEIYLARDGKVLGRISITTPIRKDAKDTIKELHRSGIEVFICSGGDEQTIKAYVKKHELNVKPENIITNCVPIEHADKRMQAKTTLIERLRNQGHKVAFVGDGGNDAGAMGAANLGVCIKSSFSHAKTEQEANVVISGHSLLPIITALTVGKQAIRNIKISLGISLAYNLTTLLIAGGLLVAVGFTLNPAIGVALMIIQACLILAAAYYFKHKSLPQPIESPQPAGSLNASSDALVYKNLSQSKPQLTAQLTNTDPQHDCPCAVSFFSKLSSAWAHFFGVSQNPVQSGTITNRDDLTTGNRHV